MRELGLLLKGNFVVALVLLDLAVFVFVLFDAENFVEGVAVVAFFRKLQNQSQSALQDLRKD